eukprot:5103368-Prymnesium_polylepis.1
MTWRCFSAARSDATTCLALLCRRRPPSPSPPPVDAGPGAACAVVDPCSPLRSRCCGPPLRPRWDVAEACVPVGPRAPVTAAQA